MGAAEKTCPPTDPSSSPFVLSLSLSLLLLLLLLLLLTLLHPMHYVINETSQGTAVK